MIKPRHRLELLDARIFAVDLLFLVLIDHNNKLEEALGG